MSVTPLVTTPSDSRLVVLAGHGAQGDRAVKGAVCGQVGGKAAVHPAHAALLAGGVVMLGKAGADRNTVHTLGCDQRAVLDDDTAAVIALEHEMLVLDAAARVEGQLHPQRGAVDAGVDDVDVQTVFDLVHLHVKQHVGAVELFAVGAFDDDQDYLREIRVAWLNNLHNGVDGEVDYKDVLKMATSRGAKISACGLSSGFLEPGGTADFTMISVDSIEKPYADSGIDPLALLVQRGTRQSVIMTCVNGKIAWQQNDESRKKEKDAEIQICTAIKELRAKDDGKRDNSIVLQHVHDFYTKRK